MSDLPKILYAKYKEPLIGINLTKHFFERLEERNKIDKLKSILNFLNKNICIIIFEMSLENITHKVYEIDGVKIPIVLVNSNYPKLFIKTIY